MVRLFAGDDWAEDHHDVEVMDESGKVLAKRRLPEGVAGIAQLHELVGRLLPQGADSADVVVGIETDRGPWVAALIGAGYTVYPVNPNEKTIEGLPVYARIEDLPVGVERFSLYVPPSIGITLLEAIKANQPTEVYLNPGSESDALIARAEALGLEPILACSIIEIGERP